MRLHGQIIFIFSLVELIEDVFKDIQHTKCDMERSHHVKQAAMAQSKEAHWHFFKGIFGTIR